jgi:hypothetical protein
MPLEEVSRYLDHSSTVPTRRYAQQTPEALDERAARALAESRTRGGLTPPSLSLVPSLIRGVGRRPKDRDLDENERRAPVRHQVTGRAKRSKPDTMRVRVRGEYVRYEERRA